MSVTSDSAGGRQRGLSLDQWIALNDEIAALVRAGLPLEHGLASVAGDDRGRLSAMARALAHRLDHGESLADAIAAEGGSLPPVYRAVVLAGARTGRLGPALEGLATAARNQLELRRVLSVALMYPLIVLCMGYILFMTFAELVLPRFFAVFADFHIPVGNTMAVLAQIGWWAHYLWPIGPVLLVLILLGWWWTGRASVFPGSGWSPLRWVPWMRTLEKQSAAASFADLAAILIEQDVPLPDVMELAGRSSGDAGLASAADALAVRLRRGETGLDGLPGGFPPLLAWLMSYGNRQGQLAPALRHAAETYRRRAWNQAELVRTFLPMTLTIAIGGTAVIIYGLLLFIPFSTLLNQLSESLT